MHVCPTCGQALAVLNGLRWHLPARALVWSGGAVTFTGKEAKIFDVLWSTLASGETFNAERIVGVAYADEIDGGPLWAQSAVGVFAHRLRGKLKNSPIDLPRSRAYRGYRLVVRS